jgi:predicted GNAT superfamily acetyltransferase
MTAAAAAAPYEIRELASHAERADAVRMQEEIWGDAFSERVPAAILMVGSKIGGVTAGAFDAEGRMAGFVFGLTGLKDGRRVHWSDLLAVRPEARGRRIGERLKHFQRDRCRALGVETMYWTYDPFVARNAHLNLNILGATIAEFVPDMYGTNTNSRMHGALGTDRFVAAWAVSTEPAVMPSDPALVDGVPVVAGPPGAAPAHDAPLPDARRVVVQIPHDYHALLDDDITQARAWRQSARRAFRHYLDTGYHVTAFVPGFGDHARYLLSLPD